MKKSSKTDKSQKPQDTGLSTTTTETGPPKSKKRKHEQRSAQSTPDRPPSKKVKKSKSTESMAPTHSALGKKSAPKENMPGERPHRDLDLNKLRAEKDQDNETDCTPY